MNTTARAQPDQDQPHDAVVIGGGPAGLSAALILGRMGASVVLVDSGNPRNAAADHSQGFLTRDGAAPREIASIGREEVARYGVTILDDAATSMRAVADAVGPDGSPKATGPLEVTTASGRVLRARTALVTTGITDELAALPSLPEVWGRDAIHCPFCHGWELRGRPTVLLAHDGRDTRRAVLVTRLTDDLTVVLDGVSRDDLPADDVRQLTAAGARFVDGPAEDVVVSDGRLTGVRLADGQVLPARALYASTTITYQDRLLRELGAATVETPNGRVVQVDAAGLTSVPRVWAAGNAIDHGAQIVHAAAAGYRAAQAMVEVLARTALPPSR